MVIYIQQEIIPSRRIRNRLPEGRECKGRLGKKHMCIRGQAEQVRERGERTRGNTCTVYRERGGWEDAEEMVERGTMAELQER